MHTAHEDELREWARGLLPLEAATELLIRTGWAAPGYAWIRREDDGRVWQRRDEHASHRGAAPPR